MDLGRPRILIDNPAGGGFLYWLVRLYAFALVGTLLLCLHLLGGIYIHFARSVPTKAGSVSW